MQLPQRKNNSYFLNEKIQVLNGDGLHSQIDFKYIPSQISSITKGIRDSIARGELPDASHMNITINILGQGVQINSPEGALDADVLQKIWEENGGHQ